MNRTRSNQKHRHFILYKPWGFVSQFIYPHKRKKGVLGDLYDFPEKTMAIGRLDADSEGLLLLTTDGKLSNIIRSKKVEKEYYAQLDGVIDQQAVERLQSGVEIGINGKKYETKPCQASLLSRPPDLPSRARKIRDDRHGPTSWLSIVLTEGKFRQIRKMTAAVGFPTLRLVRIRIGNVLLDDLKVGEVREVGELEVSNIWPNRYITGN
jgi:23S rRNA pseudouridine2457 synthase